MQPTSARRGATTPPQMGRSLCRSDRSSSRQTVQPQAARSALGSLFRLVSGSGSVSFEVSVAGSGQSGERAVN